jgi:cation transport ATPase
MEQRKEVRKKKKGSRKWSKATHKHRETDRERNKRKKAAERGQRATLNHQILVLNAGVCVCVFFFSKKRRVRVFFVAVDAAFRFVVSSRCFLYIYMCVYERGVRAAREREGNRKGES